MLETSVLDCTKFSNDICFPHQIIKIEIFIYHLGRVQAAL